MKLPNFLRFEPFNRLRDQMNVPREVDELIIENRPQVDFSAAAASAGRPPLASRAEGARLHPPEIRQSSRSSRSPARRLD